MKNRDLMFAGSLLLALGLTTPTQAQEQLFFYGFEDNLSSFTDSAHPLDSIKHLRYYTKESDGNGGFEVEKWTLDPVVYDTALYLLNGVQTCQQNDAKVRANDTFECINETSNAHSNAMEALGAIGGNYYLHFKTDKNVDQSSETTINKESGDYQGCVFIRNIPIEDNSSYRLMYYRKTGQPTKAKMYSGILRGFYNSEKSISMNGDSGNEFMLHSESGISSDWERVVVMSYYQNDSVANRHCYKAGYWWSSSWKRMGADGKERVYIEQPDKFFVRLTFSAPDVDYYVDDISLYESWIGGAEYNQDIVRVSFGYDTNLKELAAASPLKAITLPGDYFTITGIDSFYTDNGDGTYEAERVNIPVTAAEYHDDGYLYIFLAEDGGLPQECSYYGDVRISFTNPIENPGMALKYDGTLYPMSLDTIWAKTKYVPNFSNEFVLPNKGVSATPVARLAPTAIKIDPVNGSFKLPANTSSVKVYFNKPVYVDPAEETTKGVKAVFTKSGSVPETWFADSFDASDSSVIFTRNTTTDLAGEYKIDIIQARAGSSYAEAPVKSFSLEFGAAGPAPIVYAKDNFSSLKKGDKVVDGFSKNSGITMFISEFKGLYSKALMFGMYATSGLTGDTGTGRLFYKYTFEAAGEYKVSFGLSGCNKGSWNDGANVDFRLYKSTNELGDTLLNKQLGGSSIKTDEGGEVTKVDEFTYVVTVVNPGEYTFEWRLPNESCSSGHKGGRVMYYFEVSNIYTIAQQYMRKVDNALIDANSMKANADADVKFSGSVLTALNAIIAQYTGFTTSTTPTYTDPALYNKGALDIASATSAMKVRIDSVNLYYAEYAMCDSIVKSYDGTDTANVVVVADAKALVAANVNLNMPTTEPAALRIIIKNIQNATKAMNDRKALKNKYFKLVEDVKDTIDHMTAFNAFAEYGAMQTAYNGNKDVNVITSTDAQINAAIDAIQGSINAFNAKLEGSAAMTVQIKKLLALAASLEVDFNALSVGATDKIDEIMLTLDNDNADLVAALKLAIKAKMYDMLAKGTLPADLDLSGFITNPNLYCTAVVDVHVEYYKYSYGTPADRWKAKKGTYTDVFPGWSLVAKGGNLHVGYEGRNWTGAAPVFDGSIAADWSSSFALSQTVNELPLGVYNIGVGFNNKVSNAGSNLMVFTDGVDITYIDTVLVNTGSEAYPTAPNIFTEDMTVTTGTVKINMNHASLSGWARADNFALTFKGGLTAFDYATLAADLTTAAADAIAAVVTGVESVTVNGSVEYYNLNGIRLAAPQKGINIKVTTGADGKRVSEKILVK